MIDKEIAVSADHIFTFDFYESGLQIVPSSASVVISNNQGTTVSSGSATIDTSGDVTYTFTAATNTTLARNFKIAVTYTFNSKTKTVYYTFDVVKTPLYCVVKDEDLFAYVPELRDRVKERTCEVTATGSTTVIVCADLKADSRDFTGGYLTLYVAPADPCGITDSHDARITVYDKTTGTVTFTPAYSTSVASGTAVTLRPSYSSLINRVWLDTVMRDIRNMVGISSGYIDSATLSMATVMKALSVYCFSQVETVGDKWEIRANKFDDEYKNEIQRIQAAFDKDEDGSISDDEENYTPAGAWIQAVR